MTRSNGASPTGDHVPPTWEGGDGGAPPSRSNGPSPDPFLLEDTFADPVGLLSPTLVPGVAGSDVLVAVDTNALLLPFAIGKDDLGALAVVYKTLAAEKRLFLPARAAREFLKHRDRKIAELIKAASDLGSKISVQEGVLSPILDGLDGYGDLRKAGVDLLAGRKAFLQALGRVRDGIASWRGNDPVTTLYAEVFGTDNTIEHDGDRPKLLQEWARRSSNKVPPGYKDRAKGDEGIGDFLIWKSLLRLGRDLKRDLVFVTGEEKADWFVRSAGDPVFARPELIAEYRAASGGRNLHLSSLHEFLAQFGAKAAVVEEVRLAEASANFAVRAMKSASTIIQTTRGVGPVPTTGEVLFDYALDDGRIVIPSDKGGFELRFSRASDVRIQLHRSESLMAIMRLRGASRDALFDINDYDASSDVCTLESGAAFGALNAMGEVLIGRIRGIGEEASGGSVHHLRFVYRIFQSGVPLSAP